MRILFAVDLTEPEAVTQAVTQLADQLGAELLLLHVSPPPSTPLASVDPMTGLGGFTPYAVFDPTVEAAIEEAQESHFQQFLAARFPGPVRAAHRRGDYADTILDDADELGVDLLILGKRHHSRLERWLLGSVAGDVVERTTRPILLMPIPEEK